LLLLLKAIPFGFLLIDANVFLSRKKKLIANTEPLRHKFYFTTVGSDGKWHTKNPFVQIVGLTVPLEFNRLANIINSHFIIVINRYSRLVEWKWDFFFALL
jgi:hypothetical protein